jgi:hypothetical protein
MRELRHLRYYRLKYPLPFNVSFPSVVYRLDVHPVTGCPQWVLEAVPLSGAPNWGVAYSSDRELLLVHLYLEGFDIMHPTAVSTIMERLCRMGRAERISKEEVTFPLWRFLGDYPA